MKDSNIIFGFRTIIEAVNTGKSIDKILIQNGLRGDLYGELRIAIRENDIPCQFVPVEKLDRITPNNHQGVIAYLSEVTYYDLEEILYELNQKNENALILILDKITDVRNFGAIARTAECAGVDAIVIPAHGAARIDGDAVKTSAGALMHLKVCKSFNLKDSILLLKSYGVKIVAATEKADAIYTNYPLDTALALILGNEETGVSKEYLKMCDGKIAIPMFGKIGSLNVSVSAGIILYEICKQRKRI